MSVAHPQKPQQIRMSSPSTPKNPSNSRSINHFPPKNSWHSSYAPLGRIEVEIKKKGRKPSTTRGRILWPFAFKNQDRGTNGLPSREDRHLPSHQDQRTSLPVARHHRLRLLLLPPQPPPRPRCRLHSQSRASAPRNRAISAGER